MAFEFLHQRKIERLKAEIEEAENWAILSNGDTSDAWAQHSLDLQKELALLIGGDNDAAVGKAFCEVDPKRLLVFWDHNLQKHITKEKPAALKIRYWGCAAKQNLAAAIQ